MPATTFTITDRHPLIEIVRQFTPNWFTVTMGTGILSLAIERLPQRGPLLHALAESLWLLNMVLFAACTLTYATRWLLFTAEAKRIFSHGTMSLFFGAIPMGFATIVNGLIAFGDAHTLGLAHALWWIDAAQAAGCAVAIPYLMFTRHDHRLDTMTALWLMPVVACVVSAASGGLLVAKLPPSDAADRVFWLSYGLWAMSMLPAFGIQAVLFLRMALHKLPARDAAATCWLSLGPVATAGFALLTLGDAAPTTLAAQTIPQLGAAASGFGVIAASLLWGASLWWFALAALITLGYLRQGLPFNLGWWAFTFPIGNFALCSFALGAHTGAAFFSICGSALVLMLAVIWLVVAARTLLGAWRLQLFVAPCLASRNEEGRAIKIAV